MESAVADLRCLIRLHLALTRITVLMRSASGPPPPSSNSADGSDPPPKAHSMAAAKPHEQHSAVMANGHAVEHGGGDSPVTDISGSIAANSCVPLSWQADQGSGIVFISAVGPSRAVLNVALSQEPGTQPNGAANSGSAPGLPAVQQLQLSIAWAAAKPTPAVGSAQTYGSSSAADGRGMSGIQCQMSAVPELPASVLEAFADMAGARWIPSLPLLNICILWHAMFATAIDLFRLGDCIGTCTPRMMSSMLGS